MQWASSTQSSPARAASKAGRAASDSRVSGVVSTTSVPPSVIRARASRRSAARSVLSRRTTGTLQARRLASWSRMRAISGEITSVGRSIITAGTW